MIKEWVDLISALEQEEIWPIASIEEKEILVTLLLVANTEEKQWEYYGRLYTTQPGQLVISYNSLVQLFGKDMPVGKLRLVLRKFALFGFLTEESINEMRMITIKNWESYVGIDKEWKIRRLTAPYSFSANFNL